MLSYNNGNNTTKFEIKNKINKQTKSSIQKQKGYKYE